MPFLMSGFMMPLLWVMGFHVTLQHRYYKTQQESDQLLGQESQQPPTHRDPVRSYNTFLDNPGLDFAVIGFAKTGTSFLLHQLKNHPEIYMDPNEFCKISEKNGDRHMMEWLQNVRAQTKHLSTSEAPRKYGIKCPTIIASMNAFDNSAKTSSDTRLVLGLRHPVRWFESFYNYRVRGHYKYGRNETIPTPFKLANGKRSWKHVSTFFARYDVYMRNLRLHKEAVSPNPFKVFAYHTEQLGDEDKARGAQFQADLKEYLGLNTPLMDFDQAPKKNSAAGRQRRPETIDICEPRYRGLRKELVKGGRKTGKWIRDRFMKSPDVFVSDKENFRSILETWGEDPCK
ncbi:hypothetical protein ACHAWF_004346 [Thalassiosira exigua]